MKHGFPNGQSATIGVSLRQLENGGMGLEVADKGVGLPDGFDLDTSQSQGMNPVSSLAMRLGAAVQVESGQGALFRFSVKENRP